MDATMKSIDILNILLIRLKGPEIQVRLALIHNIADLLIDYKDDPYIKKRFLEWLRSQKLETFALLGLGIVCLVNGYYKDYFTYIDIMNNFFAKSILSEIYLQEIFPNNHIVNYFVGDYNCIILPNETLENRFFKQLPLERLAKDIDKDVMLGFFDHWKREFNYLSKLHHQEDIQYYRNTPKEDIILQIVFISAAAILRSIQYVIRNGFCDIYDILAYIPLINPITLELLPLKSSYISSVFQKNFVSEDYVSIISNEFIPIFHSFFIKNNDHVFTNHIFEMNICYQDYDSKFAKLFTIMNDFGYPGFCQKQIFDIMKLSENIVGIYDIKITCEKAEFWKNDTLIGYWQYENAPYNSNEHNYDGPEGYKKQTALFIARNLFIDLKSKYKIIYIRNSTKWKNNHMEWLVGETDEETIVL